MFRSSNVPPVDAHAFGQHVHDAFERELGLVAAEATHGAAVRIVRVYGLGLDVDVRDAVDAARMTRCAERALGARGVVPARIGDDTGPQRHQMPVGVGANRERDRHRVTFDVMLGRLRARQHRLDRPSECERGDRRLRLDRQLLLRAEGASAGVQHDFDVRGIQVQHFGDLLMVVQRTLALRIDLDAFTLRHDKARFRLEERDVDRLSLECLLDPRARRRPVRHRRRRERTPSQAGAHSTRLDGTCPPSERASRSASTPRTDRSSGSRTS